MTGGKTSRDDDLDNVERKLGVQFPVDYRQFLLRHDGAKPESNIFPVSGSIDGGVNQFIPSHSICDERKNLEELAHSEIPIAWAEGGNYVYLETSGGGYVFFWDHEDPASKYPLAKTFSEFIELLRPFDPEEITLSPDQVKKAWIDPDFLRSLKTK